MNLEERYKRSCNFIAIDVGSGTSRKRLGGEELREQQRESSFLRERVRNDEEEKLTWLERFIRRRGNAGNHRTDVRFLPLVR